MRFKEETEEPTDRVFNVSMTTTELVALSNLIEYIGGSSNGIRGVFDKMSNVMTEQLGTAIIVEGLFKGSVYVREVNESFEPHQKFQEQVDRINSHR